MQVSARTQLDGEAERLAAKIEAAAAELKVAPAGKEAVYQGIYDNLVAEKRQILSERAELTRQLGAAANANAAQGVPQVILVLYKKSLLKADKVDSFETLCRTIQREWRELRICNYSIKYCAGPKAPTTLEVSSANWQQFVDLSKPPGFRLRISTSVKGFSKFKLTEMTDILKGQLGCGERSALNGKQKGKFLRMTLGNEDDAAAVELIHNTVASLKVWHALMPSMPLVQEAGRRGYVNLILAAALSLAVKRHKAVDGALALIPELRIPGHDAVGPVDYVALYRLVMILVTEAKQQLDSGYAQVLAQLSAARDDFATRLLEASGTPVLDKKRRHYEMSLMERLSSAAILTNGDTWQLIRYVPVKDGKPSLVSGIWLINFDFDKPERVADDVRDVILRVAQLVSSQMEEVDLAIKEDTIVAKACEEDVMQDLLSTSDALAQQAQEEEEELAGVEMDGEGSDDTN